MSAGRAGANRVLVKVCNTEGGLGFYLRLGNENGTPLVGARVDASTMPPIAPAPRASRTPAPRPSVFDVLRTAAEASDANAAALESYARYLVLTGSDDRDEHKARQLAAHAAELEPTIERIELAYQLADERGERMRFVRVAEERFADLPRTKLLTARLAMGGARPVDALTVLAGFDPPV